MIKSYKLIDKKSVRSNRFFSQKLIVLFDMFIAEEVRLIKTDLRGNTRDERPPGGSNSFNFMQFLGNFGKIVCWRPPPGGLASPPTGKSWIRHCMPKVMAD